MWNAISKLDYDKNNGFNKSIFTGFFQCELVDLFWLKICYIKKKIVCEKTTQEKINNKDCEKRNGKGNETNLLPK